LRLTPKASVAAVTVRPGLKALLPDDLAGMGRVLHLHLVLLSGGQW
jgi:hypothetical protein